MELPVPIFGCPLPQSLASRIPFHTYKFSRRHSTTLGPKMTRDRHGDRYVVG